MMESKSTSCSARAGTCYWRWDECRAYDKDVPRAERSGREGKAGAKSLCVVFPARTCQRGVVVQRHSGRDTYLWRGLFLGTDSVGGARVCTTAQGLRGGSAVWAEARDVSGSKGRSRSIAGVNRRIPEATA